MVNTGLPGWVGSLAWDLGKELEHAELHGYLALLYYLGVADADGKLRFPRGGRRPWV